MTHRVRSFAPFQVCLDGYGGFPECQAMRERRASSLRLTCAANLLSSQCRAVVAAVARPGGFSGKTDAHGPPPARSRLLLRPSLMLMLE